MEIVFLIIIIYDVRKYIQTKKREYIINVVLTIGFAYWALAPYYNSYVGWQDAQKKVMISTCEEAQDKKLCKCLDDALFKGFTHDEYIVLDKNSTDYKEFIKDATEECQDESWF